MAREEKLYIVATNDRFETTLGTFDTIDKVAEFLGTNKNAVYSKLKRAKKGIPTETKLKVLKLFL